jgi:hypothetical protein
VSGTAPAPRAPEKSLVDKLGVKPGQRIAYIGRVDEMLFAELANVNPEIAALLRGARFDWVFLGIEKAAELARLARAGAVIKPDGGVWIVFPKGRPDLKAEHLIAAAKSCGLVDNKVARVCDRLTAMKFVIPLSRRKQLITGAATLRTARPH